MGGTGRRGETGWDGIYKRRTNNNNLKREPGSNRHIVVISTELHVVKKLGPVYIQEEGK